MSEPSITIPPSITFARPVELSIIAGVETPTTALSSTKANPSITTPSQGIMFPTTTVMTRPETLEGEGEGRFEGQSGEVTVIGLGADEGSGGEASARDGAGSKAGAHAELEAAGLSELGTVEGIV